MPKYIQYYKLQKYVEGQPVQEFKKGEVVKEDWWPTMGSCEQNDQPTWEIVNNEFICEKDNASNLWNQYQKLQKYVGGQPYLPEEFMKGEIVQSGVEFENQEVCVLSADFEIYGQCLGRNGFGRGHPGSVYRVCEIGGAYGDSDFGRCGPWRPVLHGVQHRDDFHSDVEKAGQACECGGGKDAGGKRAGASCAGSTAHGAGGASEHDVSHRLPLEEWG